MQEILSRPYDDKQKNEISGSIEIPLKNENATSSNSVFYSSLR
jgi:hypothetical protein